MDPERIQIEDQWREVLAPEFKKEYFDKLAGAIAKQKQDGKIIYPPGPLIFNAFNLTPFDKVKVVVLGQDPYHGPGEAMGLSFSVPPNIKIPPSLRNIYTEIMADVGISKPTHGDLTHWAKQGVFLLNAMLTVQHKTPGSHKHLGWQHFTDAVIKTLSDHKENLIFMLWGRFAQSKRPLIDEMKHYVLQAAHPSPLARNAFSGCRHFSKTNELLEKHNHDPIDWQIS